MVEDEMDGFPREWKEERGDMRASSSLDTALPLSEMDEMDVLPRLRGGGGGESET